MSEHAVSKIKQTGIPIVMGGRGVGHLGGDLENFFLGGEGFWALPGVKRFGLEG